MKPKNPLCALLLGALLFAPCAHAQLTWDPTGGGASDGAGTWLNSGTWWNGADNTTDWFSGSDAIFGNGGTGGAVTLASPTTVGSLTFNSFSGTYTLGTSGQALTINSGITMNAASGAVSLTTSPIILGGIQTWTNNSSSTLTATSGLDNNGNTLTFGGTGDFAFNGTSNLITGSGGITMNGTGRLVLGSGGTIPAHNYSGTTTVNSGVLMVSSDNLGSGNLTLNGGVIETYWATNFTRTLGSGVGEMQLTGGVSGFSLNGKTGANVIINNNANYEVVWGSTYFNPTTLALQSDYSQQTSALTFQNKLDLNGANRIVQVSGGTTGQATATMSGVIRDSGSGGGLTKTGDGLLILTGNNTYTGNTVVNGGTLRFGSGWSSTWTGYSLASTSNLEINGAIVQAYYALTRTLGTGAGEIQITGGRAGFTNMQGDASGVWLTFTDTGTTVTWGSAAFNPTTLVLNDVGASGTMRWANPFDLNGAARTIEVSATGSGGGRGTYGTMEGDLSGAGASLVKTGVGTLMLNGSNSYDGGTAINSGGLWFNKTSSMSATGSVTVNDGTILGVTLGGGGWTTGTSGVGTLGGLLAGDGGQTATQVGYVGNVRLSLMASGTQTYAGDIANVGTTLGLEIGNKDGGTASQDPFADPTTATVVLSGNNTYTGGTFLNRGALAIGSATALGSGALTFAGGTLQSSDSTARTISNSVLFDSTVAIGGTGDITFSDTSNTQISTTGSTRNFNITNSGTTTFNQVFTPNGGASITKQGTGDLRLNGVSSFGGNINIQQGNLIAGTDSLNNTNGAFGKSSGTIAVGQNGGNIDAGVLAGGAFTIGRNFQLSSNDNTDTGSRVITFGGNSAGNSVFSGNIILGTNSRSTVGISLTAAAGGQSTFSGVISDPTGQSAGEIANALAGTAVTKVGAGTVVLTGTNTYTGATSINSGIFSIGTKDVTTGSINNSAVRINGGNFRYNSSTAYTGTLTFTSGKISGTNWTSSLENLTIGANQTVSPGNSPGTATTTGQTWAAGGTYEWEINNITGAAGADPGWDLINGTGTLDITASSGTEFIIDITSLTLGNIAGEAVNFDQMLSYAWLIADFDSVTGFDATDFTVDASGFTNAYTGDFGVSLGGVGVVPGDASQIYVTYTAIPEPRAALLGCLGVLLLLRRRR